MENSKHWTNKFADEFQADKISVAIEHKKIEFIKSLIGDRDDKFLKFPFVLDVGCGVGYITKNIFGSSNLVVGVDQDISPLKIAKKYLFAINASGTLLPFKDKSFDLTIANDVIEHLQQAERDDFLEEIKRVSKIKAIINTPNKKHFKNLIYRKKYQTPPPKPPSEYTYQEFYELLNKHFQKFVIKGFIFTMPFDGQICKTEIGRNLLIREGNPMYTLQMFAIIDI